MRAADVKQITPGPWPEPEHDNDGNGGFSEWWEIEGIARVYKEADARLIAAAPDMYAELNYMVQCFRGGIVPSDWLIRASAALTKAEGRKDD